MLKVNHISLKGISPSGEPVTAVLGQLELGKLSICYSHLDEHKSCDSEINLGDDPMQFTQNVFDDLVDHEFKLTHFSETSGSDYDTLSDLLAYVMSSTPQ